MENIVLDTNCLVSSLKRSSIYFPIWRDFILGKYCLCFTDDILHEYQEIIEKLTESPSIAHNIIDAILNRSNIRHIEVFYHFELITADNDDNKFVDCAIKANAKFIVSNDKHFDVLKTIPFPQVNVIDIDRFLEELKRY
ncbi:MAG: putative toxin-antitoxin system toxin component, PIN family [Bacteroidales bacterium]|nr:putative toxin-antitoxin system toxin component, PIN family [Candidatus Scybalocola fimicaballi]